MSQKGQETCQHCSFSELVPRNDLWVGRDFSSPPCILEEERVVENQGHPSPPLLLSNLVWTVQSSRNSSFSKQRLTVLGAPALGSSILGAQWPELAPLFSLRLPPTHLSVSTWGKSDYNSRNAQAEPEELKGNHLLTSWIYQDLQTFLLLHLLHVNYTLVTCHRLPPLCFQRDPQKQSKNG